MSGGLALLVAFGTSVCGVSAILTAATVSEAEERDIFFAITLITIFGFLSLFVSPFIANALFAGNEWAVGMYLGTAVHDTAQVAGAALFYEQYFHSTAVVDTALVTKMMRNFGLIFLIPLAGLYLQKKTSTDQGKKFLKKIFPPFLFGFLLTVFIRSLGDYSEELAFGFLRPASWWMFIEKIGLFSSFLISLTMAAIGASFSLHPLLKMGWRPFFLGLAAASCTGLGAATVLLLFST